MPGESFVHHVVSIRRVLDEVVKKLGERESTEDRLATLDALIGHLFLLRGKLGSGEWPVNYDATDGEGNRRKD